MKPPRAHFTANSFTKAIKRYKRLVVIKISYEHEILGLQGHLVVSALRAKIYTNPRRSAHKLEAEYNIYRSSVLRIVHEDLKFLKLQHRPLITTATAALREEQSIILLQSFTQCTEIIFSDEKKFDLDTHFNCLNHLIIDGSVNEVPSDLRAVLKSKSATSLMVWGGTSSQGFKLQLVFLQNRFRINQERYISKKFGAKCPSLI
ncbi:uncharacterized protein [Lepeophtheirus salmonis]|uniref:uncharacterized protein n=1 Tax=Lepeophtheirus salmonis TaxID=72036 RepID=UPI003AF40652